MLIDIVTSFPEYFTNLRVSMLGKAQNKGLLTINTHDLHDWTHDKHRSVDARPIGGGPGMVMKPEVWAECLDELLSIRPNADLHENVDLQPCKESQVVANEPSRHDSQLLLDIPPHQESPLHTDVSSYESLQSDVDLPSCNDYSPTNELSGNSDSADNDAAHSCDNSVTMKQFDATNPLGDTEPLDTEPLDTNTLGTNNQLGTTSVRSAALTQTAVSQLNHSQINPSQTTLIFANPSAPLFNQRAAQALSTHEHLIFGCGRSEGYDGRIPQYYRSLGYDVCEYSIGDYVLNGGEVAVCVMIEAITRLIPGYMNNYDSVLFESYSGTESLLEHRQYAKPAHWRDMDVPDILLSGHHAKVERFRRDESLRRTSEIRPDIIERLEVAALDKHDLATLSSLGWDVTGAHPTRER